VLSRSILFQRVARYLSNNKLCVAIRLGLRLGIKAPQQFHVSTKQSEGDIQYIPLSPPHKIKRSLPNTVDAQVDWEFLNRLEYESPETFVVCIPKGCLFGHSVITPDNYLLADLSIESGVIPKNAARHSIFRRKFLPRARQLSGRVVCLSSAHSDNSYFHWMFDLLPRFELLRRAHVDMRSIDYFVVNSTSQPFQQETLKHLGIENVIEGRNQHLKAEMLLVPSLPGVMGDMPRWTCDFLRKEFLAVAAPTRRSKLIYISRQGATYRKLRNEAAVVKRLEKYGFQSVALEEMTFAEQVSVFKNADVVAGPHGGGLTNLVFCSPATKVIELFSPKYVNGCYWALSNQLDHKYFYLLGEGERLPPNGDYSDGGADFEVDEGKLLSVLTAAGVA